jgi:flagellin-like protein
LDEIMMIEYGGLKNMKHMRNEEAVSPVIGVILMVVITVIIAAILAVFAFGIGGPVKAPQAQLKFVALTNSTATNITVSNTGGDSLILKDEKISATYAADGSSLKDPTSMNLWAGDKQYLAPGSSIVGAFNNTEVGEIIIVQVLDVPTGQLISNARITVQ